MLLLSVSALILLTSCKAEIREFKGLIAATSTFIHYSEGYLVAPGFVDVSGLHFEAVEDGIDDEDYMPDDRKEGGGERPAEDDDDLKEGDGDRRQLEAEFAPQESTLDIVLFYEPKNCSNTRSGCDWTQLGIGASDRDGDLRWCCSNDAIDRGFCDGGQGQYGRLIVNSMLFAGQHRFVKIPASGNFGSVIKYPKLEEKDHSGKYVFIIANCNDEGRNVMVDGTYVWKSDHGYLPGDIFGEMYFFLFLTAAYFILSTWYGISMKLYEDSFIPIQKWILATSMLGLLETFFRSGDYMVWNTDGSRFWFVMYVGIIIGVLKRALSRVLGVMVSLGWGVVKDQLDDINKIVLLGIIYTGAASARDIFNVVAVTENETLSIDEEEDLFDAVEIVTFVVACIDVVFYMWILDAMNDTMQSLENMNQSMKLRRYLRLRLIFLFSILFAIMWSVVSLVNMYMVGSILKENEEWTIGALMELNYLALLVGVSILWRPNPNAKEYAYVMELPALGGEENGLELTEHIPSAMDDDEEEEIVKDHGFKDEPDGDSMDFAKS